MKRQPDYGRGTAMDADVAGQVCLVNLSSGLCSKGGLSTDMMIMSLESERSVFWADKAFGSNSS